MIDSHARKLLGMAMTESALLKELTISSSMAETISAN